MEMPRSSCTIRRKRKKLERKNLKTPHNNFTPPYIPISQYLNILCPDALMPCCIFSCHKKPGHQIERSETSSSENGYWKKTLP
jgi:hypothetical protein